MKNLEEEILQMTQNAFNVMWDTELSTHSDTTMSETPQVPKVSIISESTESLTHQQRIAKINTTYYDLLETSDIFIQELKTVIDEMSKTIEWILKK